MLRGTASLAHCKEKFGAEPVDYPELRLERLPYPYADQAERSVVKRALWFRDVQPFARVQGVAPLMTIAALQRLGGSPEVGARLCWCR